MEDIDTLKESITEYHELLENKIKKLPNIISSSNLRKQKKDDELYELYLADPEKSERSEESRHEGKKEARKEIKKLSSEVSQWKKAHKNLFDMVTENQKLYSKIVKSKNAGPDSVNMLKELFKKSNLKMKELMRNQYELHYTQQKKPKSHRNIPEHHEHTMSPKKDSRSQALLRTEDQHEENHHLTDDLVDRINELRAEIRHLKTHKEESEAEKRDFETFKVRHSLLKQEYEEIKRKYDQLQIQTDSKDKSITNLTRQNSRLSEQLASLQNENKSLEEIIDKNRTTEFQAITDFKTSLNRCKRSLEAQITNTTHNLQSQYDSLDTTLTSKVTLLHSLEATLSTIKHSLHKENTQKSFEISELSKETLSQKSTIAELQKRI